MSKLNSPKEKKMIIKEDLKLQRERMTEQTKIEVDKTDYPHEFNKAYLIVEVKTVPLSVMVLSVYGGNS